MFANDAAELDARRHRMVRDGYRECDMPACNCGSWHKQRSRSEVEMIMLIKTMIENDPNDYAADATTVLDVWREDAKRILGRHYGEFP